MVGVPFNSRAIDPRVPSAPVVTPPRIPLDPSIRGRAQEINAAAVRGMPVRPSAATWDNSIPEMVVNNAPEIGPDPTVITPAAGEPEVDPNSIEELMRQFLRRSGELDAERSKTPKWQEELMKDVDPDTSRKRNISRALVAFGSALSKTPGNFLTGLAAGAGAGAGEFVEGQDASRDKRTKALATIDQVHRGNQDASLARLAQGIGLGTAFQKAKGTGAKRKTEGQVKAEAQLTAIRSAETLLRGNATDGSLPGFEALLEPRNRWGTAGGAYGRGVMTGKGQAALDALRTVIQMSIYSLSGAQAPETEVNRLLGLATPGIMDGEEAIAGKRAQVNSFLDMIHKKASEEVTGPSPDAMIAEDENGNRKVYVPQLDEWVSIE